MSAKNRDRKNRWRCKTQLALVLDELKRIEAGAGVDDELLDNIRLITVTLNGMKEECEWTP